MDSTVSANNSVPPQKRDSQNPDTSFSDSAYESEAQEEEQQYNQSSPVTTGTRKAVCAVATASGRRKRAPKAEFSKIPKLSLPWERVGKKKKKKRKLKNHKNMRCSFFSALGDFIV